MIFGIGTDITKVSRFEKWVKNPEIIERFFNPAEFMHNGTLTARCEHYAVRFAAKEAFSKALGTGITGFNLRDVYIENDSSGKPELKFENSATKLLNEKCGNCKVHVSLSHEKEFAIAYVIIEI